MGFKPYSIVKEWLFKHNLKIKDYSKLSDDDKAFVDYTIENSLKLNPILRLGNKKIKPKQFDFWLLSWSDIIMLRHHLSERNIQNVLELIYSIKPKDFLNLHMFNSMAVYKWIAEQVKNISEIEKQELDGEPTQDEIEAGIERLQEFGYAVSLDQLSKGNLLQEDALLEKPYSVIFRKLCLNKTKADIQKQDRENARRKNQRGHHQF